MVTVCSEEKKDGNTHAYALLPSSEQESPVEGLKVVDQVHERLNARAWTRLLIWHHRQRRVGRVPDANHEHSSGLGRANAGDRIFECDAALRTQTEPRGGVQVREGMRLMVRRAVDRAALPHHVIIASHDDLKEVQQAKALQCLDNVRAAARGHDGTPYTLLSKVI